MNDGKPRFIRVRGRIVPVREKGAPKKTGEAPAKAATRAGGNVARVTSSPQVDRIKQFLSGVGFLGAGVGLAVGAGRLRRASTVTGRKLYREGLKTMVSSLRLKGTARAAAQAAGKESIRKSKKVFKYGPRLANVLRGAGFLSGTIGATSAYKGLTGDQSELSAGATGTAAGITVVETASSLALGSKGILRTFRKVAKKYF